MPLRQFDEEYARCELTENEKATCNQFEDGRYDLECFEVHRGEDKKGADELYFYFRVIGGPHDGKAALAKFWFGCDRPELVVMSLKYLLINGFNLPNLKPSDLELPTVRETLGAGFRMSGKLETKQGKYKNWAYWNHISAPESLKDTGAALDNLNEDPIPKGPPPEIDEEINLDEDPFQT